MDELAQSIAIELKSYLIRHNYAHQVKSLSFIGFSMGGLLIRASLRYLAEYSDRFKFLMTFNTPHIGVSFKASSMSDVGLWVLKKFVSYESSVKQLTMGDAKNMRECFLYRLAMDDRIGLFKYIILIGSHSDSYVKPDSCFIHIDKNIRNEADDKRMVYEEMIDAIWRKLACDELIRVHVPFKDLTRDIESVIGKKSHVHIISNFYTCNILIKRFDFLFA